MLLYKWYKILLSKAYITVFIPMLFLICSVLYIHSQNTEEENPELKVNLLNSHPYENRKSMFELWFASGIPYKVEVVNKKIDIYTQESPI